MNKKDMIKKRAKRFGMSLCGIAGIDRFGGSLPGRHPTEILPGCKSVIVLGVRLLDGIVQANCRAFEDGRRDLKGLWGTYGYAMLPNFELTYACYGMAQYIENNFGEVATPLSTGPQTNGVQISIRHSAVAAGLGEIGWMGLVLTPQFGPRNRFGVILTTLELEPDPLYEGNKLCDPEKCGICTSVCPTCALSKYKEEKNPKTFEMGGNKYEYCNLDWNKCQMGTLALTKELGGADDYVKTDSPTDFEIYDAQRRMAVSENGLQHVNSWHCGKCQTYCPVGNWSEKFIKRGLTKGPGIFGDKK
jgi:epoxyqueuosine reductase QueG